MIMKSCKYPRWHTESEITIFNLIFWLPLAILHARHALEEPQLDHQNFQLYTFIYVYLWNDQPNQGIEEINLVYLV